MKKLIKNARQIVTVNTNGKNFKRGPELAELDVLENHSILVEYGLIKDILPNASASRKKFDEIIDLQDKIILPGLVECHTHTAFAGSRANEFRMRLNGAGYEDIARAGGGIISTVKAVRNSSFEELTALLGQRINNFISQGVTSLEIKSGYGLSYYDEIKLLQVINYFRQKSAIEILPTFLGAHTFPPEYKNEPAKYLDIIINEMLPFIADQKLALYCDAFCEKTAFSPSQVDAIFTKARELGLKLKLHTEQFNIIGGLDIALSHRALSVDHLEVLNDSDISKLSQSDIVSVLLPGASFFLDYGYAPARKLIDSGAVVAISTDFNPGSSPILNLHLVMSIAAIKMNMSIEETISAVTINAAKALDTQNYAGSIEIGKNADFAVFDASDYSEIIYNVGNNLTDMTIKNGKIIYQKNQRN